MSFLPQVRVCIVGSPLFRAVGDEVFVLMPDSRVHWLKNASAKALWDRLIASGDAGVTPLLLAAELARGFDVSESDALPDVIAFLDQLAERKLVAKFGQDAPHSTD